MAVKQTAGRDALGEIAPKFAELNDDMLFGEVWSREEQLSLRDRSLVTVIALMAQGLTDESFRYHLMTAKKKGISSTQMLSIAHEQPMPKYLPGEPYEIAFPARIRMGKRKA